MAPSGCSPFAHLSCVLEELGAGGEAHAFLSGSAWSWGTFMTAAHQGRVCGHCEDRAVGPEGWRNLAHPAMLTLRGAASGTRLAEPGLPKTPCAGGPPGADLLH